MDKKEIEMEKLSIFSEIKENVTENVYKMKIKRQKYIRCFYICRVLQLILYVIQIFILVIRGVILGMPWLERHNPEIDWKIGEVKMTRSSLFSS